MLQRIAILLALAMVWLGHGQAAEQPDSDVKDQVQALIVLSQEGIGEEVLIAWLNRQPPLPNITPAQILELKKNNLSARVIEALIQHNAPPAAANAGAASGDIAARQPDKQPLTAADNTPPTNPEYPIPDQTTYTPGSGSDYYPDYVPETYAYMDPNSFYDSYTSPYYSSYWYPSGCFFWGDWFFWNGCWHHHDRDFRGVDRDDFAQRRFSADRLGSRQVGSLTTTGQGRASISSGTGNHIWSGITERNTPSALWSGSHHEGNLATEIHPFSSRQFSGSVGTFASPPSFHAEHSTSSGSSFTGRPSFTTGHSFRSAPSSGGHWSGSGGHWGGGGGGHFGGGHR
jgi:hypothetical protein